MQYIEAYLNLLRQKKQRFFEEISQDHLLNLWQKTSSASSTVAGVNPSKTSTPAPIGEGRCFKVYALRGNSGQESLVLKVPHTRWQEPASVLKKWREQCKNLQTNDEIILLCPFKIVEIEKIPVMVQPRLNLGVSKIDKKYMPFEPLKEEFLKGLKRFSINYEDTLQIGALDGLPVVYDWSDF